MTTPTREATAQALAGLLDTTELHAVEFAARVTAGMLGAMHGGDDQRRFARALTALGPTLRAAVDVANTRRYVCRSCGSSLADCDQVIVDTGATRSCCVRCKITDMHHAPRDVEAASLADTYDDTTTKAVVDASLTNGTLHPRRVGG